MNPFLARLLGFQTSIDPGFEGDPGLVARLLGHRRQRTIDPGFFLSALFGANRGFEHPAGPENALLRPYADIQPSASPMYSSMQPHPGYVALERLVRSARNAPTAGMSRYE